MHPKFFTQYVDRLFDRTMKRFWSKVRKTNECWIWTGGVDRFGYGELNFFSRHARAHRIAYEVINGQIPDGLILRHTCDVPACVNPSHLILGDYLDNARDRDVRGRSGVVGTKNPHCKLTEDNVREIRRRYTGKRYGEISDLMREFGIKAPALYAIINRTGWKHIRD